MPPQVILNAVIAASAYVLVGLGFALIYRTAGFFHFSHGVVFTIGAYTAYVVSIVCPSWWVCVGAAAVVSAVVGLGLQNLIYNPMQRRAASPAVLMLASLGSYLVLQNTISLMFGDEMMATKVRDVGRTAEFLSLSITPFQAANIACAVTLTAGVILLLRATHVGLLIRAVANDCGLCDVRGVGSSGMTAFVFTLGSALAGVAGALVAFDTFLVPTMGLRALMMGITAVIVGGLGSTGGILLGALLLAMAQHAGAWFISAKWQDAIGFLVLTLFLVFRPQGFWGVPLRKAKV
jgi:branched-chain amino acid transport system permease protein